MKKVGMTSNILMSLPLVKKYKNYLTSTFFIGDLNVPEI